MISPFIQLYTHPLLGATTPVHYDDITSVRSSDGAGPAFGGSLRYPLIKNSTLIGLPTWVVDISAAVIDPAYAAAAAPLEAAAYVNKLGDQIIESVTFRYGSNIIQTIPRNVFTPAWVRLTKHDNHIGKHILIALLLFIIALTLIKNSVAQRADFGSGSTARWMSCSLSTTRTSFGCRR